MGTCCYSREVGNDEEERFYGHDQAATSGIGLAG